LFIGGAFTASQLLFFSTDRIDFSIVSEQAVDSSEKHDIYAVVINNSDTALQDVRVAFIYPSGTEAPDDPNIRVKNDGVAALAPGEKKTFAFSMVITTLPGGDITPKAELSFRTQAVSLRFSKEATRTIKIVSLPIDIALSIPEVPSPGKEFTLRVSWESKAQIPISNIGLQLDEPEGFEFVSSTPETTSENYRLWDLGTIDPVSTGEISITGKFTPGAPGGDFVLKVGQLSEDHSRLIQTFKEENQTIRPTISSLLISQRLQGAINPAVTAIDPGETFDLKVLITNTTNTVIKNTVLTVFLPDKYFQINSLRATETSVSQDSEKWIFDGTTVLDLRSINPGAQKEFIFQGRILNNPPFNTLDDRNPKFIVRSYAESGGLKLGDTNNEVRINGKLILNQGVLYNNAPGGQNSGPVPPRVGQTTTYTVVWDVIGGTNGMQNVTVRGVLAPEVNFVAVLFPEDEPIIWDQNTRELRWNIGDLPAGIGIKSEPRELSFRISFIPSFQDIDKFVPLVLSAKVTGRDVFTSVMREFEVDEVTTQLPDDTSSGGKVQP